MGYIYFIKDWAGYRKFAPKTFKTTEDASDFLLTKVNEEELEEFVIHSIMISLPPDATPHELSIWESQTKVRCNLITE